MAPLISRFVKKHAQVEVQLQLSVNPPPLAEDAFDVCIRFGAPPDARVIARHIAPNRRLLCTPDADIHAVYPQHHQLSARVRAFVDFVAQALQQQAPNVRPG